MTGVSAGSGGTGVRAGSQGSGAVFGPSGPLEPIFTSTGFSETLGAQTFTLPAEAVDGTWVVFFYSCSGTNAIGDPSTWTPITVTQRVGCWYKQISGDTVVPSVGASNGYPHYAFMVFDAEIAVSQVHSGIFTVPGPQPVNIANGSDFTFAQKTAVAVTQSVYGWRHATNDHSTTVAPPVVKVRELLTMFGADSAASLLRQDGAGVNIELGFSAVSSSAGASFVLEAL